MVMRSDGPLKDLEEWEEDLLRRYPEQAGESEERAGFRDYGEGVKPGVRAFYKLNHEQQTVGFVESKRAEFLPLERERMTVWEALEFLNTLVDDSDPDIDLPQIEHLLQTAEAIRADGHPRWMVLTGLIHDLGKVLCLWGEPQWAVVGDTFPVGCAWSDRVVLPEYFAGNPDAGVERYQRPCGIYEEGCGLDRVLMSWGHDEYLYHVVKDAGLPEAALYMIRYHSFYAAHREGAYTHLMSEKDRKMFGWVRAFNPYDLYTKSEQRVDVEGLRPYYDGLIEEFLPGELAW